MKYMKTADMVLTAVFAALICVFSLIAIPTPLGIPVTLQTFIIALAGFASGSAKGFFSVLVYIGLGLLGIPVFSGFQGGFSALFGITGGFIVGFIPFVMLCGIKKGGFYIRLLFGFIGLCICHICGILWFCFYGGNFTAAIFASVPYLVKDVLSVVFALIVSEKITVIIQKFN